MRPRGRQWIFFAILSTTKVTEGLFDFNVQRQ